MLNMHCIAVGERNVKMVETARSIVGGIEAIPTKYISLELADATRQMRKAVDSSSPERVLAHADRLITSLVDAPKNTTRHIPAYIIDNARSLRKQIAKIQ